MIVVLTYGVDETVYPDQCTKAGAQRAHRGTATDLRNAWRPNDGREKARSHRHGRRD